MDITKTFKCDEEFLAYLSHLLTTLHDYNLSEIIRQSVLIAGPFLEQHPRCGKSIEVPKNGQ
jgi:hypothetical protein